MTLSDALATHLVTSPTTFTLFLVVVSWLLVQQLLSYNVFYWIRIYFELLITHRSVPILKVALEPSEATDDGVSGEPSDDTSIFKANQPNVIHCYDPSTRQLLGMVPRMTPEQVEDACRKAKNAQVAWSQTTFAQRRLVLRTLQAYIVQHTTEVCRVSARDSGKPPVDALLGEVLTTCEKIRCLVYWGELWLQPESRPVGLIMAHKTAMVEYVPLGLIATIAPWNYPFHNMMNHVVSALLSGNALVSKVSEHTSWSSANLFTRLVQQALIVNGHDPDLVQTVTGGPEAGEALCRCKLVDKLIFTGSPAIGKLVMKTCSETLTPVILELGGKDAMVIMDDCKLADVVPWVMRGCFQNCGQNCVGIERVLVYESLYDEFIDAVTSKVKALRQGVPLAACGSDGSVDCGSMVMATQLNHIQALVDDAVKMGARVLVGGSIDKSSNDNGQFYPPTVLADVTPKMRIYQEEVFGPVMTIVKVVGDSDEVCLELVNDSEFGLGSSVYCGDQKRGLALGLKIRSGMCCINDFGSNYLVQSLPFGGVGQSGFGRFGGVEGLRALCLERSILTDRIPGVRTSIPSPIDYPIDKTKGFPFASALVQILYSESLWQKVKGIVNVIKFGK
ncbi:hypothetical protein MPSEU_000153300 [Mayamaea pseudoterrestris]|nr:hypothetical protein MPSEU_000153300 [Mayamaea pseudoterrestris]